MSVLEPPDVQSSCFLIKNLCSQIPPSQGEKHWLGKDFPNMTDVSLSGSCMVELRQAHCAGH